MPTHPRLPFIALAVACALSLAACGGSSSSTSTTSSTGPVTTTTPGAPATTGFEGIVLEQGQDLAPASTTAGGNAVDGIHCGAVEQLAYHIHVHLHVYADGESVALPAGIGIPGAVVQQSPYGPVVGSGTCFYWLHTHTSDGVIHVESPTARIYTLGNFFDVWQQPLTSTRVGSVAGKVTAFLNGKRWTKAPRDIPLDPHNVIQLDVGTPAPAPQPISFSGTQL
jgi:hypothetical protein